METAGQTIARLRKERGWNQAELGRRMGVSGQQVMRYETKGIRTMRVHRLYDMADALGCTVAEILGIEACGEEPGKTAD